MTALPYTICFCLRDDQVLMLYRSKPPNAGLWNGLGGKIEAGETPLSNIHREVMEEAAIDLHQAQEVHFTGLVTWPVSNGHTESRLGMYVFVARLSPDCSIRPDCFTAEGLLAWQALGWVCDRNNSQVVSNIPHFLPPMLNAQEPQEYRFSTQEEQMQMLTCALCPELSDW
jgi:8-oxo-dGTP diphosphatase